MTSRTRRVTVRAYNLRPGDVVVSNGRTVETAIHYPGSWSDSWVDVTFTREAGKLSHLAVGSDDLVTVTRTYA